jgi:hypothetical protein
VVALTIVVRGFTSQLEAPIALGRPTSSYFPLPGSLKSPKEGRQEDKQKWTQKIQEQFRFEHEKLSQEGFEDQSKGDIDIYSQSLNL